MDRATYDLIDAVNFSSLKHIDDCPAMYWHWQQNVEKDKDAYRLGRAFHCSVLEPQEFDTRFAVWTGGDKRKKRELWEEFQETNCRKDILTATEAEQARRMGQAARANSRIGELLRGGKSEHAILWTHKGRVEVAMKGMLDHVNEEAWVNDGTGAILDLKSTLHPDPDGFGRDCFKFKWYVQAALYVDGYEAATGKRLAYYLGAVGKVAPFLTQAYRVTDADLLLGRECYERWLDTYVTWRDAGNWPAYSLTGGERDLQMPRWAYDEDETDAGGMGVTFTKEAANGDEF